MAYVPVTLTDEEVVALEAKYEGQDLLVLRGHKKMSPWVAVIRRPTRQETLACKASAKRDPSTANETLIARITVYPSGADWERQLDRWPLLCDAIADDRTFKDFVGFSVEADVKG